MASKDQSMNVWYHLMTPDGKPYADASVAVLELPSDTDIARFLEAVRIKNDSVLTHTVASDLQVFKNKVFKDKASLDKKNKASLNNKQGRVLSGDAKDKEGKPLDPRDTLAGLGMTESGPLIVVVPEKPTKTFAAPIGVASPAVGLNPKKKKGDPKKKKAGVVPKDKSPTWHRPTTFNQGGYSALYVESTTGLVRFVQITCAKQHDFDWKVFMEVLTKLVADGMEVKLVELAYVVPTFIMDTFEPLDIAIFKRDVIARFNHARANQVDGTSSSAEGEVNVYGLDWPPKG